MTIIARTGLNEGKVYNAAGSNVTETPDGVPNGMVGSFYLDFSALTGQTALYTNELSVIISDGRVMSDDSQDNITDDTDDFDPDEGDVSQDETGIDKAGHSTTVTQVLAQFRMNYPDYGDVNVFGTTVGDTPGEITNGYLAADQTGFLYTAAEWLDEAKVLNLAEAEADVWWAYRGNLRFSLHWALYIVPLEVDSGEGQNDDLEQAQLDPEVVGLPWGPRAPVPAMGPSGMLYALGGGPEFPDTENQWEWPEAQWVKLWEPGPQWWRPIRQGNLICPYVMNQFQASTGSVGGPSDPSAHFDFDIGIAEIDADNDFTGARDDTPDVTKQGDELVLNIRCRNLNIHVGPNEMLVLHVQTGRVRLTRGTWSAGSGVTPGLVLAEGQPAMGPRFTCHRYWVTARAKNSPL